MILVLPAWLVLVVKFAISGVSYNGWAIAPMGPVEFSTAFIAIVGIWLGREIHQKKLEGRDVNGSIT